MAKRSLVVVESPTKVKTIQKYLDSKYIVKASMGHVRDLPKSKLGVDVKKGFKPEYRVLASKRKVMDELKKAAEKAEALYVATDPDREGEAIGWHLAQELKVTGRKVFRVTFNEITARAIKAGLITPLALAYFALWTVRLGGWLPHLGHCARCGVELHAGAYRSAGAVFLCENCRLPGQSKISQVTLELARRMFGERLERLRAESFAPSAVVELRDTMLNAVEHHIERPLQARRLLADSMEPRS